MSTQILENRFAIEKQLSHTDFSSVYLACDRHYLHRPRCIVTAVHYRDPEMRHRLERETQILDRLGRHPQIPRVLAYFNQPQTDNPKTGNQKTGILSLTSPAQPTNQQTFYIVQDQIIGHPLSQEIIPSKRLSGSYVAKFLQDVLIPLSFAHDQDIIHQNLHPQNLIRQEIDGQIFLTDFGTLPKLARSVLGSDGTLSSSVPVGLQPYIAPEQLQNQPQLASDLYALGLMAIEALTGKRHHHFTYDQNRGLLWRSALTSTQTDISLPLIEFIDRLIRHDWQDRFANAGEALSILKAHNDRHKIAHDSQLPTIVAAPGPNSTGRTTTGHTRLMAASSKEAGVRSAFTHHAYQTKPPNPYLYKLATGSIAVVIALGVGVKAFQWGEYRLSLWPQVWQEWTTPTSPSYLAAHPNVLTPLMADGSILVRPAAAEAFWKMVAAARADKIELYPLSGYRGPSATEVTLKPQILSYSAGLTTAQSDYTTGYALDIGGAVEESDKKESFARTKAFKWLMKNAQDYGFELSLPKRRLIGGNTSDEPWHWRYVGDSHSRQVFGLKER